ncbi:hypothetical protein UFOVP1655_218 [uncultured Caudovirales phage]|uniref:Uncharacterized protein n=1 Tax=uncultured Caudovirales phage TaxID=2100421 RepID=A0A6J5T524_9CAUD|nr:hypothetical protein UFOVP1655_218 [uncultured Caudovirales phage]
MFNEDTKNLIDYAYQDNGTAFRDSLYNAIHDKVSAHIESKKQEIAAGLMGQQEEAIEESKDDDDDDGAYELDDPKHPTWAKRYLEKADSKRKSDKEVSEGVAGVSPGGTCLASSNRPSIFSAKAHKEFDRVKNLSDKDSKDYHDTQIKKAQNSQRLRSEDAALEEPDDSPELKAAQATSNKASKLHGSTNPIRNIQGHLLDRKASKMFKKTPEHAAWKEKYGVKEEYALEEGRKPSPITGTRKIASYEGDHGHTAEVRHSREYNEYQVHHYKNGVHQGEGPISYHGDDKEEAHDNAKYEVGMQPEIIKKK